MSWFYGALWLIVEFGGGASGWCVKPCQTCSSWLVGCWRGQEWYRHSCNVDAAFFNDEGVTASTVREGEATAPSIIELANKPESVQWPIPTWLLIRLLAMRKIFLCVVLFLLKIRDILRLYPSFSIHFVRR